jgi:hypothetical protein
MRAGKNAMRIFMDNSRLDILQKSLEANPRDAFTRYLLALELSKLQRHAEATAQFEKIIEEHPNYVPTYYQFAQLHENLGRTEQAIQLQTRPGCCAQRWRFSYGKRNPSGIGFVGMSRFANEQNVVAILLASFSSH